jgi:release factor glutamine methyltransferase
MAQSVGENLRVGQYALAHAGIEAARLEARLLLEWILGCSHAQLLTHPERILQPVEQAAFDQALERRVSGEPLAYVFGEAEFRGRLFQVTPDVLIPRPETELLIDLALERMQDLNQPSVVDLGTGSGIVAISLALECPKSKVLAIDLSEDAVSVARNNAGRLSSPVQFLIGDWFGPLAGQRFDLVVSNPPYVAAGDPHLALNGLPHEPQMALTDGADGLECIRRIVADAPAHLNAGGWLLFEHGYDQGNAARNLLTAAGFKEAFTQTDLACIDRVSGGHL